GQEEGDVGGVGGGFDIEVADQRQESGDVDFVHVAVAGGDVGDPVVPVTEGVDGEPLGGRDVGGRLGFDRQDQDVFVQDVIVFHVRAQRQRGGGLAAVEEDGGARHPLYRGPRGGQLVHGRLQRTLVALALTGDQFPPFLPGGHDGEHDDADENRKPGPMHELGQVRGEEQQVDAEEEGRPGRDEPGWPTPGPPGDVEEQQG